MNFTVHWLPKTEQELAALWLVAPLRSAVTRAAHVIDRQLQQDPEAIGESRPKGLRIHIETPLGVLYRVRRDQRLVEVVHVWRFD